MINSSQFCCSVCSVVILTFAIFAGALGQKNGEFKHELPEGVELVDPKSLGLTDADLSKFLGNVKVLGGGQVGDTKTQILTVGFDGDESINFNDFHIPGLSDGNNSSVPSKDKEIAQAAFKKFKEFFENPGKANQFEDDPGKRPSEPPKYHQQQKNPPHENHGQFHRERFQIPMIQKPYTTPATNLPVTTHRPLSIWVTPPPPPQQLVQQPPPHLQHSNNPPRPQHPPSHLPPLHHNRPPQQQQHIFNAQIKSNPTPPLEFGARIPTSPNPYVTAPPPPQIHQPNPQRQFIPSPQVQQLQQQQQHRLATPHHSHNPPQHQQVPLQHPSLPPLRGLHQPPLPPHPNIPNQQINFVQHPTPPQQLHSQRQQHQHNHLQRPSLPSSSRPPAPVVIPNIRPSQSIPQNSLPQPTQSPPLQTTSFNQPQGQNPPHFQIHPIMQLHLQDEGKIVRNQLLHFEADSSKNQNVIINANNPVFHNSLASSRPLPRPTSAYSSASNQIPIHHSPQHLSSQIRFPQEAVPTGTSISHIYIQRGPNITQNTIQHTPFHTSFQAPTRMAKDFTPIPSNIVTVKPIKPYMEVTPSMKLIHLSTNENAITDPIRLMQFRLYQKQKREQLEKVVHHHHQTEESNESKHILALPQQKTTPNPTILTANTFKPSPTPTITPISITTSYPEHNSQPNYQSLDYFKENNQVEQDQSNNEIVNQGSFWLQNQNQIENEQKAYRQYQQLMESHHRQRQNLQNHQPHHSSNPPTVFFRQGPNHRRPPRHGRWKPHHKKRRMHPQQFQYHFIQDDPDNPPIFYKNPGPPPGRRKRGHTRFNRLFKRMFRN